MDVSIIIVNLNSRQLLADCLTSIYEHTRELTFEVIVVDNASSDGSVEMVNTQFPQVRLIANEVNNRYAIANNQGLAIAQGKYVLYLNGDTLLQGNSVKDMADFLNAHPETGGVGVPMMYPDGRFQDACFRFPSAINVFYLLCVSRFYWKTWLAGNYPQLEELRKPHPVDFVVGACFMTRRNILKQIGGMDEDYYFYGEDSDLCYRIWQAGWPLFYVPGATSVIHYGGVSSTSNLFDNNQRTKHLWGWKSRFVFIKKHYPFWRRAAILFAIVSAFAVNGILYGMAAVKRRDWQYFTVNTEAHLEIAQAAFQTLQRI